MLFNRSIFQSRQKTIALLRQQHEQGWLAGGTIDHLVNHELAHVMRAGLKEATQGAIRYAKLNPATLSKYAATNPHEAFAEAWSIISTEPSFGGWKISNVSNDPWLLGFADALDKGFVAQGLKSPPPLLRFLEAARGESL